MIEQNLKFDCSIQVRNEGRLVNQICLQKRIRQYSNTKAGKYSGCFFPIPVGAGGLFSRNTLLLCYVILSYYLLLFDLSSSK